MAIDDMRAALVREQERLEGSLAALQKDWHNAPRLALACILGVPVGIAVGPVWGALFAAVILSLAATVIYLVGVRRQEYRIELDEVVKRLTNMEGEP